MLGKADRTELHQEKSQHFNNGLEVSGIRVFSDSCQLSQIKKHLKGSSLSVLKRHLKPIGANTCIEHAGKPFAQAEVARSYGSSK